MPLAVSRSSSKASCTSSPRSRPSFSAKGRQAERAQGRRSAGSAPLRGLACSGHWRQRPSPRAQQSRRPGVGGLASAAWHQAPAAAKPPPALLPTCCQLLRSHLEARPQLHDRLHDGARQPQHGGVGGAAGGVHAHPHQLAHLRGQRAARRAQRGRHVPTPGSAWPNGVRPAAATGRRLAERQARISACLSASPHPPRRRTWRRPAGPPARSPPAGAAPARCPGPCPR
jgi:hypothetical protein